VTGTIEADRPKPLLASQYSFLKRPSRTIKELRARLRPVSGLAQLPRYDTQDRLALEKVSNHGTNAMCGLCHVWTYMDPPDCNRSAELVSMVTTADVYPAS
jgi:hypothetical protein